MSQRTTDRIIPAVATSDGAGVSMHRAIGTHNIQNFDPFLMLDYFGSDDPDTYIAGFPDHPHRGFITLTYMIDGRMQHRDSMGNEGNLGPGGIQWMKAASGVIHSEMPKQESGLMRGFQLWINLPAAQKMSDPEYQEFQADDLPMVVDDNSVVKVICGSYGGTEGPVNDPITAVNYLDISLEAGAAFSHETDAHSNGFFFVFEGTCEFDGESIPEKHVVTLSQGAELSLSAGDSGARLVFISGRPIGEPIAQHGPFVMNTHEELIEAVNDYQQGRLVQARAAVNPG